MDPRLIPDEPDPANEFEVEVRLLEALLAAGHVTPEQARRARRHLGPRATLAQALERTPLVDPLTYARLRRDIVVRSAAEIVERLRSSDLVVPPPMMAAPEEGYTVLSFESVPADLPPLIDESLINGRTPMPEPDPNRVLGVPEPPPLLTDEVLPAFEPFDEAQAWPPPVGEAVDLQDDEGIPLLVEMNAWLGEAVFGGAAAMQLAVAERSAMLRYFDRSGVCTDRRRLDASMGNKVAARWKVMARVSPWRAGPLVGSFGVRLQEFRRVIVLRAEPPPPAGAIWQQAVTLFMRRDAV